MNEQVKREELFHKETRPQTEAFQFFDQLESVDVDFMVGLWKGKEWKTNHPMDGVLEAIHWYGKEFINAETVHPLVFQKSNGTLYSINPGLLPLNLPIEKVPQTLIKALFPIISPFLITKKAKARLRMLSYRGVVSAAMIYDQHGICDMFRKVDENTVLGVMDAKGQLESHYFFVLERVKGQDQQIPGTESR